MNSHFDYRNAVPTALDGQQVVLEAYEPVSGGGQAIDIGSSSNRSTQLTVGAIYHVIADVECYVALGDASVTATSADYHLVPGFVLPIVAKTGKDYLAVIRRDTDAAGGLSICRVR